MRNLSIKAFLAFACKAFVDGAAKAHRPTTLAATGHKPHITETDSKFLRGFFRLRIENAYSFEALQKICSEIQQNMEHFDQADEIQSIVDMVKERSWLIDLLESSFPQDAIPDFKDIIDRYKASAYMDTLVLRMYCKKNRCWFNQLEWEELERRFWLRLEVLSAQGQA